MPETAFIITIDTEGDDLQPPRVGQLLLDLVADLVAHVAVDGQIRVRLELLVGVHLQVLDAQPGRLVDRLEQRQASERPALKR